MENLRDVILKMHSDFGHEYDRLPSEVHVRQVACILRGCTVSTKKISIVKKPLPLSNDVHSDLTDRGLYGYPMVFVNTNNETIRVTHKYMATPFAVKRFARVVHGRVNNRRAYQYEVDHSRFAIPEILTKSPFMLLSHDLYTADLGRWLSRLPEMTDLDMRVQKAWDEQVASFSEGVQKYVAKNSERRKKDFQVKLAEHLSKSHIGELSADDIHSIFKMSLYHNSALKDFIIFCVNNQEDRHWVNESDFSAALKLMEVTKIMED